MCLVCLIFGFQVCGIVMKCDPGSCGPYGSHFVHPLGFPIYIYIYKREATAQLNYLPHFTARQLWHCEDHSAMDAFLCTRSV